MLMSELSNDRLKHVVDKLTTAGKYKPEVKLVKELCHSFYGNIIYVNRTFQLLMTQLHKPHAQVRLGVLQLWSSISSPSFLIGHLQTDSPLQLNLVQAVSKRMRDLVLSNLQDIASLTLRIDSDSYPLPKPLHVAKQMQRYILEVLLDWEDDLKESAFDVADSTRHWIVNAPCDGSARRLSWHPQPHAVGQLKHFLSFIRDVSPSSSSTSSRSHAGLVDSTSELTEASCLLGELERSRKEQRKMRTVTLARNRKRLKSSLKLFEEMKDLIEENMHSLSTNIEILVPDPFASTIELPGTSGNRSDSPDERLAYLRSHGRLVGSTSVHTEDIELIFPCSSASPSSMFPSLTSGLCVSVDRTESTDLLRATAQESIKLFTDKHKPLLEQCIATLSTSVNMNAVTSSLQMKCSQCLESARQLLHRLESLLQLFNRIVFVDTAADPPCGVLTKASANDFDRTNTEDTSDSDDMEEVEPTSSTVELLPAIDFRKTESLKTSCSDTSVVPGSESSADANVLAKAVSCQAVDERDDILKRSKTSFNSGALDPNQLLHDVAEKPAVVWRSTESLHRFWQPIDPEEYKIQKEYMETAISFESDNSETPTSQIDASVATQSAMVENRNSIPVEALSKPNSLSSSVLLSCWAPLLSGGLCKRKSATGRCVIHGRVVKRDPVSGRPVRLNDRKELQIEASVTRDKAESAKIRELKRLARKRYPGLIDLKEKPNNSRSRLSSRVLSNRSIKNVADDLNKRDQQLDKIRFADNYHHSISWRL